MAGAATGWNPGMISGRDNGKAEDERGAEMKGEERGRDESSASFSKHTLESEALLSAL